MKFTTLAALSAAVLGASAAPAATATNNAIVINDCDTSIYVQSVPFDGSAAGKLTTVKPGERFTEKFRASGSTVKIAKNKNLDKPLFFGYSSTTSPNVAYYEFSTKYGNPFADEHNILSAGDGCDKFDCKAGDKNCYSTASKQKNYHCPSPVNVYAKVCAS